PRHRSQNHRPRWASRNAATLSLAIIADGPGRLERRLPLADEADAGGAIGDTAVDRAHGRLRYHALSRLVSTASADASSIWSGMDSSMTRRASGLVPTMSSRSRLSRECRTPP